MIPKGISTWEFIPMIVKCLQDQKKDLEKIKKKNKSLKEKLKKQIVINTDFERRLKSLET